MAKRSNLIVTIGLAVFVIGAGATFFVLRNGSDGGTKTAAKGKATVVVAAKDIPSGTAGAQAVEQGLVKTQSVDTADKPAGAISDPSNLAGKTAAGNISKGTTITATQFAAPQTQGAVAIPDGKMALALSLDPVPGVSGKVEAKDHIDIFGVVKDGPGAPSAKLIMQNTEVLIVDPSGPAALASPPGTKLTYLLAVTAPEAEHLVYLTSFQSLYFSLVNKAAPTVAPTPGINAADALKQLS